MDAEQKRRILNQAHANIARLSEMRARVREPLLDDDDDASRWHDPVLRSWRNNRLAPDEPEPEPQLDTMPAPPPTDWAAYIEERIEQERAFMLAVVGEALGNAIVEMQKDARRKDASELDQRSWRAEKRHRRTADRAWRRAQQQVVVDRRCHHASAMAASHWPRCELSGGLEATSKFTAGVIAVTPRCVFRPDVLRVLRRQQLDQDVAQGSRIGIAVAAFQIYQPLDGAIDRAGHDRSPPR